MSHTSIDLVLSKLSGAKKVAKGWSCRCPAHDDRRASLSLGLGDDGRALVHCHAGCSVEAVCAAVGLKPADLFAESMLTPTQPSQSRDNGDHRREDNGKPQTFATAREAVAELERRHGRRAAHWVYQDVSGAPVGMIVRWNLPGGDKDIRPVAKHGEGWRISAMPSPRPLYGLPDLGTAEIIFVCEGEKAADAARSIGLTATTSAHGSQSASKADWTPLAGKHVVVLPDHDDAGEAYATNVAHLCHAAGAADVRILRLVDHAPALPPGGDLADVLADEEWCGLPMGEAAEPHQLGQRLRALAEAADPFRAAESDGKPKHHDAIAKPIIVNLADVQPQEVRWLWPGRIALGKLTLIAGEPGLGKSFLTIDLAAHVTTGNPWPDSPNGFNLAGSVVILNAEDDLGDTVRPRLDKAGALVEHVRAIQGIEFQAAGDGPPKRRCFCIEHDLPMLEQTLDTLPDCRLVIIDPVSAFLGQRDSHNNAEIRGLLAPLAELAARRGVAVVAVTHLNKATGSKAMHRVTGSLAFIAAARAGWLVAADKDDPKRRLLLPIKNNLAEDIGGLAFTIIDGALAWDREPVLMTADEALANDERRHDQTEREEAAEWLEELLANGPMPKSEVDEAAKANGITGATLRRAMQKLGIKPKKEGFKDGHWNWGLPRGMQRNDQHAEGAEDAQAPEVSTFDTFDAGEHLQTDADAINRVLAEAADDAQSAGTDEVQF